MTPHLEPLCKEYIEFVRGLRNANRQWFFDTKPITEWEQETWYEKYLESPCLFWIIIYDGKPVGTISSMSKKVEVYLNCSIRYYEIGNLMLLPEYRGRGIMQAAMREMMQPNNFYVAHVKSDNSASLGLFKSCGFWRVPKKRRKCAR